MINTESSVSLEASVFSVSSLHPILALASPSNVCRRRSSHNPRPRLCGDLFVVVVVVVVVVLIGVDFLFETLIFATQEKSNISSEKKKEKGVFEILECVENYDKVGGYSQFLS